MFSSDLSGLGIERSDDLTNQEAGTFIETDDGIKRIMRQRVQPENLLHPSDEAAVDLTNAPRLLQVRLQLVFLRI